MAEPLLNHHAKTHGMFQSPPLNDFVAAQKAERERYFPSHLTDELTIIPHFGYSPMRMAFAFKQLAQLHAECLAKLEQQPKETE